MSNSKIFCKICNKDVVKGQKKRHERTKKHLQKLASGGDLQTISSNLPGFPWAKYKGEHHLPGHNYTGPGTRLDIRLDADNVPKPGEEPINRVDQAALKHDIAYYNPNIRDRQKADIDLIQDLNEIKNPTFREKLDKAIVKNVMKAKIVIGGELVDHQSRLADELHHEYRKPSKYLKVKIFKKDDIWGADLVEMPNMKGNNDFKYILTIIDLYTKYSWAIPLKNKTSHSIKNAFEKLFEETPDRIPNKLYTDNGKEFYNKIFDEFLKENEIEIYSTFNQPDERSQGPSHNPIIERFNRTLKNFMFKKFTENGNRIWINILPELINFYNNKVHSTIKITPTEASKNPELIRDQVNKNNNENYDLKEKQKFHVNDRVRIFKWKSHFEKGYTYRWSKEIFIIKKVYLTHPITYKLYDLKGEEILGRFYSQEIQKTSF